MVRNSSGKFVLAGVVSGGDDCDNPSFTPGIYFIYQFFAIALKNRLFF